jgi:Fic family protein
MWYSCFMELSFTIDDHLTRLLKRVDLKIVRYAEILATVDGDTRKALMRQARISTIGATTRIENAVLTDAQIDWIDTALSTDGRAAAFTVLRPWIAEKISKDRERSLEEVAGCREMLAVAYEQGTDLYPLTQSTLRGLHHELLKYHPPAAYHVGRYKLVPNSVVERDATTGAERNVLRTSDPGPITETAMAALLAWYNEIINQHPWPIAVASELVFRFLACHPFQDGNGRIGRALFTLAMLQCGDDNLRYVAPFLAVDRVIEQSRSDYYLVLARASDGQFRADATQYNIPLFMTFMLNTVDSALDSIDFYLKRIGVIRKLSTAATAVLQSFKEQPETRLVPRHIRQDTGLAERTVSRALQTLVTRQIIQRYGSGAGTSYQLIF